VVLCSPDTVRHDFGDRDRSADYHQVNIEALWMPGELVLDVEEPPEGVVEAAQAWARVRGYNPSCR
jgi:hypothetical protein